MNDKVSRRNRPAKGVLSRDVIVAAALEIVERDGLAGFSLRRVATTLDTGAASLYVYLKNLDELYSLMLDQALAAVRPAAASGLSWRESLVDYLLCYFAVLHERQGLAQLAMSTIATGPNAMRVFETLIGLLAEGGIEPTRGCRGIDTLLLYVTAFAAERSNWRVSALDLGRVQNSLAAVDAERFPLAAAAFQDKSIWNHTDVNAHLRWGLDALIDGITLTKE